MDLLAGTTQGVATANKPIKGLIYYIPMKCPAK